MYQEHLARVERRCLDIAIEALLVHTGILHDAVAVPYALQGDGSLVLESSAMGQFEEAIHQQVHRYAVQVVTCGRYHRSSYSSTRFVPYRPNYVRVQPHQHQLVSQEH